MPPRRASVLRYPYLAALPARGADGRGVLHPCKDKETKRRAKNVRGRKKTKECEEGEKGELARERAERVVSSTLSFSHNFFCFSLPKQKQNKTRPLSLFSLLVNHEAPRHPRRRALRRLCSR